MACQAVLGQDRADMRFIGEVILGKCRSYRRQEPRESDRAHAERFRRLVHVRGSKGVGSRRPAMLGIPLIITQAAEAKDRMPLANRNL